MIRIFYGMQIRVVSIALLLCVAIMSSACSGTAPLGSSPSATVGSPTAAVTATKSTNATPIALKDLCSLVSPAQIGASINKATPFAFPPIVYTKGILSNVPCGFGTGETQTPVIMIQFSQPTSGDATTPFNQFKSTFASTTPVANLGDEAYLGTAPPAKDTTTDIRYALFVRKGGLFFFVGQFNDADAATVVPADQKVAQLYLAHL